MKIKSLFIPFTFLMLTNCTQPTPIDMIIKNAKIYSVDEDFEVYECMAVHDGMITALGSEKDILTAYRSDSIIDMGGKAIYPGFIDPHCHFYGYGNSLREVNLFGTHSFEEVLKRTREHAAQNPEGWITGMGWDQNDWAVQEFPDNSKLDILFPDRPVLIRRVDGHAALANTAALKIADLKAGTKLSGGEVITRNGKLTGLLVDNAIELVRSKIPPPGENTIKEVILSAQENCFAVGLTSVHDAGLDKGIIEMMDKLHQSGDLKMRINAMLNPTEENFETYLREGPYQTDRLNVTSLKLYADGALGSRGALMLEPYSDDPGNYGLQVASEEYLQNMAQLADSYGYQVNTHCIGDAANRLMLDIYGSILKEKNDKRWRIEHAQVIHPDDFVKFGRYSIIPSIQTTHATSDMYWAGDRLGDRLPFSYAYKQLLKQNGWLPNGSDFPVEDINPLCGFYAAVARKDKEGYPENGFQKENALTREQALRAMTIWAARAGFEEGRIGSLEPGKKADFVVLEKDIMKIPESELFTVQVLETWMDGKIVYSKKQQP